MKRVRLTKGERYGRWTVERDDLDKLQVLCRCECGLLGLPSRSEVRLGRSTQCQRCRSRTALAKRSEAGKRSGRGSGGMLWRQKSPEERALYAKMSGARQRCTNPKREKWPGYGGRGIRFEFASVADGVRYVLETIGFPGPGQSLDRIDVNGHYAPGNLRWATLVEQAANKRVPKPREPSRERREAMALGLWLGCTTDQVVRRFAQGRSVEWMIANPVKGRVRDRPAKTGYYGLRREELRAMMARTVEEMSYGE